MNKRLEKYIDYIVGDLISKTYWEDASYSSIRIDKFETISAFLSHQHFPPRFNWMPEHFGEYVAKRYGARENEIDMVWEKYSQYVIVMWVEKNNG
jgi:hypothetical protein